MKRSTQILSRPIVKIGVCLVFVMHCGFGPERTHAQQKSLEERQPLELVFADSIVPQDRHETMLTTGVWYFRHLSAHHALLTQKVEWGLSDRLQVATFVQLVNSSNALGSTKTGVGDIAVGARYTWSNAGSPFTHVALALEAGFPTGSSGKGPSEGSYTVSPSVLLSRELQQGKYQLFSTTGIESIVKHRRLHSSYDIPRNSVFSNGGLSVRVGPGWAVGEMSVSSNRWSGGSETQLAFTPSYVWRLGKRAELLFGVPIGLTSSTDRAGGIAKFTFELGGKPD